MAPANTRAGERWPRGGGGGSPRPSRPPAPGPPGAAGKGGGGPRLGRRPGWHADPSARGVSGGGGSREPESPEPPRNLGSAASISCGRADAGPGARRRADSALRSAGRQHAAPALRAGRARPAPRRRC
ncbi:putative polyketide hydroxylase isoform X2 [Prionailurus bengalensis]|uniref:putative polyketide hydroxylase isoform X2 n=1 Tax=Prionailurus bengalensis TaxID=37029 RepID=UPI001CA82294|nr:putative polyketide hydroxylase isoform X2 [Prionailurus bengalensis]